MQASEYIAELCNKLKLRDDELVQLPSPESGLSRQVMAQYTAELERLEAMKAEKIGLLLADARADRRYSPRVDGRFLGPRPTPLLTLLR